MAHASARVPSLLPTPTPSPSLASTLTSSPDPSELSVETISDLVDPSPLPSPLPFHTSAHDYLDTPSFPLPPPFPPFCPPLVTPPPASLPSSPPIPCTPVTHPPPLRPPQRIPSPRWPPPLLPPEPRPPPPLSFCVAAQHLSAVPTSSASFLLLGTENSTRAWPCFPAPFQVFVERANGEREVLPILGRSLPLEISVVECHAGCSFQLRSLNAREFLALSLLPVTNISEFMMRPRTFAILEDTVKSARSAAVQSPVGPAPVYPPAVRIEFFLKPPLEPPLLQTSRAYFEALTEQLDNDHFAVGSGRFAVAEVSSSGAFVQADILPPARGESGTVEVGTLLQELAVRASTLNVLGHRFDVRHGLWVQGVDPTLIHEGEERAKLWPVVDDEDKEVVAAKLAAEPRPRPPVSPPPAPRQPPRSPPAPPAPPLPPSPLQPPMLPPAMPIVCSDTCVGRHNGECQDGGAGSIEGQCAYGTDCTDCGQRVARQPPSPPSSPLPARPPPIPRRPPPSPPLPSPPSLPHPESPPPPSPFCPPPPSPPPPLPSPPPPSPSPPPPMSPPAPPGHHNPPLSPPAPPAPPGHPPPWWPPGAPTPSPPPPSPPPPSPPPPSPPKPLPPPPSPAWPPHSPPSPLSPPPFPPPLRLPWSPPVGRVTEAVTKNIDETSSDSYDNAVDKVLDESTPELKDTLAYQLGVTRNEPVFKAVVIAAATLMALILLAHAISHFRWRLSRRGRRGHVRLTTSDFRENVYLFLPSFDQMAAKVFPF